LWRAWSRSILNAVLESKSLRPIRIPLACSITTRRAERSLQVVVVGETQQRDVDRALQLVRRRVDEAGENTAPGRRAHKGAVLGREQRNHRTTGQLRDLLDQHERALRVESQLDQGQIGLFPRIQGGDCPDVDLADDHLVSEPGDNLGDQLSPLMLLVGDQHPQLLELVLHHRVGTLSALATAREEQYGSRL
jgi:hypothetical protein